MKDNAEDKVSKFYNSEGWETKEGQTEDARKWEDLRECAKDYVSKCRMRVLSHIPESGENILDLGSGPIQYEEYLEYSKNFSKRYCVDLSLTGLEGAKNKIGDHGVFMQGSIFDVPLEENFFDCAISLHVIYHIDKDKQEDAVRRLIKATKPGKPVIIVYSNPNTVISTLKSFFNVLTLRVRGGGDLHRHENVTKNENDESGYFFQHPNEWWSRFDDIANVKMLPWRSLGTNAQKKLIPNNKLGGWMFDLLFNLEERYPDFFVKHFLYSMIVLVKK